MNEYETNDLSQALFEEAGDALFLVDPDSDRLLDANPMALRLSGFTRQELLRQPASYLFRAEGKGGMNRLRQAAQRTGIFHSQEGYLLRTRDNAWVPVNLTIARLHVRPATLSLITARDVREQRQAAQDLRESQRALATLMSNLPGLAYRCRNDPDWTMEFVSDGVFALTGFQPADLIGNRTISYAGLIHADDQQPVWDEVQAALRERRPFQLSYRITTADGVEKWVWEQGQGIFDAAGTLLALEGFITDVTQRKRAEEALARERALLRSLIDAIPDMVFIKDRDGVYLGCNAAFERFAGRSEKELIGLTDFDLLSRELASFYLAKDRQVLADGQTHRDEEWITYPDGRQVLVEALQSPLRGPDGQICGLIVVSRDITERKRLEEQVRHSQKMEAVGQLAGGVAHDFNNLLTAILGNVSLLLTSKPVSDPDHELLAATEQAAERASELTRQLLGFSRQTTLRLEPTDLNASMQEVVTILRRTLDPRIHLDLRPTSGLWAVQADQGQISQVLMNLCLNARDAMPDGGTLSLETANLHLDETLVRARLDARTGAFVRLRVRDTGQGIPEDIRPRIFEPFFTTKGPGKGTGLGLAMVYGIVQQHQGWIDCTSEVGQGTAFDIYLPRLLAEVTGPAKPVAVRAAPRGGETILLVDDEAVIRNVGRAILQREGYLVLLAEDGPEALDVYRRERGRIDLVVLDLTMPRLSGLDTLRQLVEIDPRASVLLSSGYTPEQLPEVGTSGVLGFVNKPYRPQELTAAVRAALERVKAAGRPAGAWVI